MILTEEQRGALAHAINYIDETDLPVGELDGFDREVLRAMIDSSDPIPDVTELVELLAAGEHEQWAGWAQAILDSEPGLSDGRKAAWPEMIATPYENLSEELKNKDRREVYLRSQAALDYIQQQSTEIERLRGEMENYGDDYVCQMKSKDARIQELEDALIEQEARFQYYVQNENCESWPEARRRYPELNEKYLKIARQHLHAEGKIGPDAKPQVWQITEERKAALGVILARIEYDQSLPGRFNYTVSRAKDTLRAMLEEAQP